MTAIVIVVHSEVALFTQITLFTQGDQEVVVDKIVHFTSTHLCLVPVVKTPTSSRSKEVIVVVDSGTCDYLKGGNCQWFTKGI